MKRFALLLAFALACSNAKGADEPPGRRLYLEGITPSGEPLRALVGAGGTPLSGAPVACGNCHGADGRGRAEGAVAPPNLAWEELAKPYGHAHPHRRHRAFDERSLARAVNEGLDPDGNRLDWAMPRYALSRSDVAALAAYLKRLHAVRDPGIGEATLRIGTILPLEGRAAGVAGAVRAALTAYVERLNRGGGIHQRRIELAIVKDLREARRRFAAEPVFALLSPLVPGFDGELGKFIEEGRLPMVAPFPPAGQGGEARVDVAFYVYSGPLEQAALLVEFAASGKAPRSAIVAAQEAASMAAAAVRQCQRRGCADALWLSWRPGEFDAAALVERLKQARRDYVFFFGGDAELTRLLEAAGKAIDPSWQPRVHAPGALARAAVAVRARFAGELYLAFPSSPADRSPRGAAAWDELRRDFGLAEQHEAAQLAALTAAVVLAEGLRRAGRELSRERLVRALEALYNFAPDFGPPVSYGPDRRTGARGGYVVALQPGGTLVPASHWIALD